MEEQIGRAHNFSDPNSKLDASFAKLDATFDKINEQIALLKSALQSFIKVRFDIAIDFDALSESSPSSVKEIRMDADAQKVFDKMTQPNFGDVVEDQDDSVVPNKDNSKVSLEDDAPNMSDEIPKSTSADVIDEQHDCDVSNGKNRGPVARREDQLHRYDPEFEYSSSIELKDKIQNDVTYGLEDGLYLMIQDTQPSLFEVPYPNTVGILSISRGDATILRHKCLFTPSSLCNGLAFANFGFWEKYVGSILIISTKKEMMYEYKHGSMYLSGQIHDSLVFAYVSVDHGAILLFDPGGHATLKIDYVLNLVLHKESRVLLVERKSGAEFSLVIGPFGFQHVAAVPKKSTLHSEVGMLFFVEGKEYWDMNSQAQIGATGHKEKRSVWYRKVICFVHYDSDFNSEHKEQVKELKVKCRLNKTMLEIHIKVQTSGDLKLVAHNLQMINNSYKIGDGSISYFILVFMCQSTSPDIFISSRALGSIVQTFKDLPLVDANGHLITSPEADFVCRLVQHYHRPVRQLQVKWYHLSPAEASWESTAYKLYPSQVSHILSCLRTSMF